MVFSAHPQSFAKKDFGGFESAQTITSQWQWQGERYSYLTCSLLQDWQHGFFTRHWNCPPEELAAVLNPEAQTYRVRQVHGNVVLSAAQAQVPQSDSFLPADGVITDDEQQAVWVASADCTPVLIGDVQTGQGAAVHAGWRGTAQRIVPNAITQFLDAGSTLKNLRIAMGPAIAGDVYQVSESVAAEIGASIFPASEAILDVLWNLPQSPLIPDPQPGKVRIDVRQVNALQLQQMGIKEEQIAIAPYCTYQHSDQFFSYRRSQQKQVQWSGIVSC